MTHLTFNFFQKINNTNWETLDVSKISDLRLEILFGVLLLLIIGMSDASQNIGLNQFQLSLIILLITLYTAYLTRKQTQYARVDYSRPRWKVSKLDEQSWKRNNIIIFRLENVGRGAARDVSIDLEELGSAEEHFGQDKINTEQNVEKSEKINPGEYISVVYEVEEPQRFNFLVVDINYEGSVGCGKWIHRNLNDESLESSHTYAPEEVEGSILRR